MSTYERVCILGSIVFLALATIRNSVHINESNRILNKVQEAVICLHPELGEPTK